MGRRPPSEDQPGILYVVATPMGNLEDITLRALRVLKEADLIVAENGVHTKRLCDHYGIRTKIATYNQHSQKSKTERLVSQLSARGWRWPWFPMRVPPAFRIPASCSFPLPSKMRSRLRPFPGPSAVVASLSVCGFSTAGFCFLGFLSNRPGRRKNELKGLASETRTMVFYESPHRIAATLSDMAAVFGSRQMVLCREMTKLYEEIRRGTPVELLEGLTPETTRGEFTLVVSGETAVKDPEALNGRTLDAIDALVKEKRMSVRDIASVISKKEDLAYRKVYKACLARKRLLKDS